MIKLFTNRELSEKLGINLAKWKRWSREFLPSDPLGGMQSGFARQYYFSDAFNVMLGGYLVGDLKLSVYEARTIIEDLKDWLMQKGFYQDIDELTDGPTSEPHIIKYKIFIHHNLDTEKQQIDFTYRIRGIISDNLVQHNGIEAREERYVETVIGSADRKPDRVEMGYEKVLNITSLYTFFIGKLGYS